MTNQEEVLNVESQYWVDKADALRRLIKNPDFQSVILEGYFKDKAINGVSMLANDGVKRRGERGDIMEMLVAVSQLQDYFKVIMNLGSLAEDDMEDLEGPQVTE